MYLIIVTAEFFLIALSFFSEMRFLHTRPLLIAIFIAVIH